MLRTPSAVRARDPILDIVAKVNDNEVGAKLLRDGVLEIGHFSGDLIIFGSNGDLDRSYFEIGSLNSYGVCDDPEQFLSDFGELLDKDERELCVTVTHVKKNPANATFKGGGGGWRWHKWGPYIGKGEPTMEYLDDEEGFEDGVYVYHVYDVTGL